MNAKFLDGCGDLCGYLQDLENHNGFCSRSLRLPLDLASQPTKPSSVMCKKDKKPNTIIFLLYEVKASRILSKRKGPDHSLCFRDGDNISQQQTISFLLLAVTTAVIKNGLRQNGVQSGLQGLRFNFQTKEKIQFKSKSSSFFLIGDCSQERI